MKKLSFVIPCYGSQNTLENVVREIELSVRKEDEYEIILIDDYSPDNVWQIICKLCDSNSKIKAIRLSKNFGQHSALMAGYAQCSGDFIISLDDDGQTPANEFYQLIDKLEEGYDVVYASYKEKMQNKFRSLGSKINDIMCEKLLNKPKGIEVNSYFASKRFIIEEICKYHNQYTYVIGLIFRTTQNIGNVEINHRKRINGKSGYSLKKLVSLWLNGFTAFSVKPLRIATLLGSICAIIGFFFMIYTIIWKLVHPEILAGYSSTISIILFVSGMIMLILGIIGEYIGRIYICINASPQYVIKETYDKNDKGDID